jgi:hypothetical protein
VRGPCSYWDSVAPQAGGSDGRRSEACIGCHREWDGGRRGVCDDSSDDDDDGKDDDEYASCPRLSLAPSHSRALALALALCAAGPLLADSAHHAHAHSRPHQCDGGGFVLPRIALRGLLTKATRSSMPVLRWRITGACTPPVRSPGPPVPSSATTTTGIPQPRSTRHRHEHCNVPVQTRIPDKLPCSRRIEPESVVGSLPAPAAGSASFRCFPPSFLAISTPC